MVERGDGKKRMSTEGKESEKPTERGEDSGGEQKNRDMDEMLPLCPGTASWIHPYPLQPKLLGTPTFELHLELS